MKISDLQRYIKENYSDDTERVVRAALMSLKSHGIETIQMSQVAKEFAARGIVISIPELLNMIQNDPMIANANKDTITFATDMPNIKPKSDVNQEKHDAGTISSMAKQALRKRGL